MDAGNIAGDSEDSFEGTKMKITLCGSNRFEEHFKAWNKALTLVGHVVYTVSAYPSDEGKKEWYSPSDKKILDDVHKLKIRYSDAILVLNVFGYVGESTLGEIEFARKKNKELYALESWSFGHGISTMHYDHVQKACQKRVPEYRGSVIDTTSNCGFMSAFDLLHEQTFAVDAKLITHVIKDKLLSELELCDLMVHGYPV